MNTYRISTTVGTFIVDGDTADDATTAFRNGQAVPERIDFEELTITYCELVDADSERL